MVWRSQLARVMFGTLSLGVVLSATLICLVSLVAQASLTRSLQKALASPYSNTIVVDSSLPSSRDISTVTRALDTQAAHALGQYGALHASVALRSVDGSLDAFDQMHLKALPPWYLAQHFTLVAGRFPSEGAATDEIALTTQTARQLKATIGQTLDWKIAAPQQPGPSAEMSLVVVGIVTPHAAQLTDPYDTEPVNPVLTSGGQAIVTALTTGSVFARVASAIESQLPQSPDFVQSTWVYFVAATKVDADNYIHVQRQIEAFSGDVYQVFGHFQGQPNVYGLALLTLQGYGNRRAAMQTPLSSLSLQIDLAVLGFLISTADLLIESEAPTLAILRGRGARARQILTPLMMRFLPVALVGSLCAPVVASLIVNVWSAWPQISLDLLPKTSLESISRLYRTVGLYDVGAIAISLLAISISLYRRLSTTILGLRRQASRSRASDRRRYPIDVVIAVSLLALAGVYRFAIEPSLAGANAAQLAPLALYMPIVALTAAMVVMFRALTPLFAQLATFSKRGRGVTSTLLFTNLAHAPQRTRQASIFLGLAIALCCFSTIYRTTLNQHNRDFAAFQVGADLSFALPIDLNHALSGAQQEDRFRKVTGVVAACAGSILDTTSPTDQNVRDRILAVDASNYDAVTVWPNPSSNESHQLHAALEQMSAERAQAASERVVPALLDDAMRTQFHLVTGDVFALPLGSEKTMRIAFRVVGFTAYLPMITEVSGNGQYFSGGMLVDYPTLAHLLTQIDPHTLVAPSYMWLRTARGSAGAADVRHELAASPYNLTDVQDRYQIVQAMEYDPLSTAQAEVITVGSVMVLFLALLGSVQMISVALDRRILHLSAMYAIGASRTTILLISAGEIVTELLGATLIGLGLGFTVSLTATPLMTFAQSQDSNLPLEALQVPPTQLVVPLVPMLTWLGVSLLVAAVVVMIATSMLVMNRISASLRLSQD